MSSRPGPEQMSLPQQVHLDDYLNIIRRRKWVVIAFFAVVVGMVSTFSFMSTPVYKATTQIIIESQSFPVMGMGDVASKASAEQDYYQTQYNLLLGRGLSRQVIQDLALWKKFLPDVSEASRETLEDQISPIIVNRYLANLQITPVRGTRLVNISFLSPSRELSARVADAHALAFIEKNIRLQHSVSEQRFDWLKNQIQEQKAKVEASQRALYEYKKANKIISLEERQNIVSQKLMEVNSALTKAKGERIAKQAQYEQLEAYSVKDENLFLLPEIAQDSVVQSLRSQLFQLKDQKAEMGIKFGPKHPKMIELDLRSKQLQREISDEVERLRQLIKGELDRAIALEDSTGQALEAQKKVTISLHEKAINYNVLSREAESNQNIYDILLKQAKEIGLASVFDSNNVRIVENAEVPLFPVKPKIFLNILLAVVLGLFMGTGLAFFVEYMDNTVKTPQDVQQRLGMPVLGAIPYEKSLKNRNTPALPSGRPSGKSHKPYYYDAGGRLPARLKLDQQGMSGQVLLIESATMGEGKTTVLGNLAVSLGKAGLRVLVTDCDLNRPALHHLFGVRNEGGLSAAMTAILSQDMGSGTSEKCGLSDLFSLIALKKYSGQLTVTNNDQAMTSVFQHGRLLNIENQNNPPENRLGSMLLRGGSLTESQLEEALERNRRTGQPLGYILINAGFITQDQLQGPLKLQTEEHFQKLFSWKHGNFAFDPGVVETYENQRIYFGKDYTPVIHRLSRMAGSRLFEGEILSRVKPTDHANIHLLPAGEADVVHGDFINFALLAKFLEILKGRFDVILVDAPPILDAAGSESISILADGVIFVVKAGHLSMKMLNEAKSRLAETNARIIGAVLNQVTGR